MVPHFLHAVISLTSFISLSLIGFPISTASHHRTLVINTVTETVTEKLKNDLVGTLAEKYEDSMQRLNDSN